MSHDAEWFRDYREKLKALGKILPGGKHKTPQKDTRKGDRHSEAYKEKRKANPRPEDNLARPGNRSIKPFRKLEFVGWDGEGIGHPRNRYVMLSNSRGESLRGHDLRSKEIFEFLLSNRADKHTIHCVYGGVYDFTHWVLSLPDSNLRELHETGQTLWGNYFIQYKPRKSFRLEDRSEWVPRLKGETWDSWRKRNKPHLRSLTVWDVIGFFQTSFLAAIYKWGIGTEDEQRLIKSMKESRGEFAEPEQERILEYNFLECRLLEALMKKLHSLLLQNPLDPEMKGEWLPIKRWDGAGAVAAAIYQREGVRFHVGSSVEKDMIGRTQEAWHYRDKQEQSDIEYALRCAYFGGRIECFKRGHANKPGYDIDIVSAYPAAMLTLPSFAAGGHWDWEEKFDPESFGVWHTKWECDVHSIYPLPYRTYTGSVLFSREGEGWHHTSEVEAAMEDSRNQVTVLGGYVWTPANDVKPFAFVQRYFDARKKLQAEKHPAEKVIKLGLNSLYGKMAQTIGSTLEDFPCSGRGIEMGRYSEFYIEACALDKIFRTTAPWFNLGWAGAVTAHCRATVYRECMPREREISMIQTDGMFGTGTPPEIAATGALGSLDVTPYDDAIVVQAGVYFLADRKPGRKRLDWGEPKTRGFYVGEVSRASILKAWERASALELTYESRPRFQTLGYAMNKRSFDVLACWKAQPRKLALWVDTKRTSLDGMDEHCKVIPKADLKKLQLHKRMCVTYPLLNSDFWNGCPSRPTNPKWREQLHATGEDDIALTEPFIEGSDYLDNFITEIQAKFGF